MTALNPSYITDSDGKRISVVLPIKQFEELIEELELIEDLRLYKEAKSDGQESLSADEAFAIVEASPVLEQ